MHIVTDTGANWADGADAGLDIHVVPQNFTLDGKNYRSGVDVQIADFYPMLANAEGFPTTAQPAPGEFATVYRQLAETNPNILSIHISSGLSGTLNAAIEGAKLVPEAKVTIFDTKNLSAAQGWMVLAAARAAKAGWPLGRIEEKLAAIRDASLTLFTLDTLQYLIHGGRISHLRGLLANVLDIKPIIGVEGEEGVYGQWGRARTIKKAIDKLVSVAADRMEAGQPMRIQVVHGDVPQYAEALKKTAEYQFESQFLPNVQISPILAAHTGPSLVGFCLAPACAFDDLPE
ncbi:MAG: DegV family protein [Anaerolineales bacterium]